MEFLLFLLYPAGLLSIVAGLVTFIRFNTGQRALTISRANRNEPDDLETGFAVVRDSMRKLRQAKTEENQLHIDTWEQQFYPPEEYKALQEKRKYEQDLKEHRISAKYYPAEVARTTSAVGYRHSHETPDEELSYSQRRMQRVGAVVRNSPHDQAGTLGAIQGGSVWRFDGYVKGKSISGNNIWYYYVGKESGMVKYVWSGATTNTSISGLPYGGDLYSTGSQGLQSDKALKKKPKWDPEPKFKIPSTLHDVYY
jgi:hypothetical protein